MKSKFLSLITLLSLLFVSCKKEANIREGNLIKRAIQTWSNQRETVDTFLYDTQKRLTGIKYFHTNTENDKQIEYDAQGRLSKIRYSYMGIEYFNCLFVYNSRGQIVKKLATPSPGFEYAHDESYAYNNLGQLISDTGYYKQTDSVRYYFTFKYDNNGNIVESDFQNFMGLAPGKSVDTFDSNPNPFFIQGNNYYYVTGRSICLSKNNIITSSPRGSSIISTEFEYQVNGLPKKFTITNPTTPGHYRTSFEYEYW